MSLPRYRSYCAALLALLIPLSAPAQSPPPGVTRAESPVRTDEVTGGDKGDVILNASVPSYGAYGVFLRANTAAVPSIAAKLGGADGSFAVFDPADHPVFRVGANGIATLQKNGNAALLEINNPYAGNGAAWSAFSGVRLWEGASLKGVLVASNSGAPDANTIRLVNILNAPLVFGTNNLERMNIAPYGWVGIGTDRGREHRRQISGPRRVGAEHGPSFGRDGRRAGRGERKSRAAVVASL